MSVLRQLLLMVIGGALMPLPAACTYHGLAVAGVVPLAGPGYVDSFTVSCGTTAAIIQSPYGQVSYRAFVDDASDSDTAFGDSSVTTSIGEPKGAGEGIGGNLRYEYCRGSETETVRVRSMVATSPDSLGGRVMRTFHEVFYPEMFTHRSEVDEVTGEWLNEHLLLEPGLGG